MARAGICLLYTSKKCQAEGPLKQDLHCKKKSDQNCHSNRFYRFWLRSQQITVSNSNSYTIILKEDTESLDEVVVVGYGTQKKVNLTGSVATISSDKLVNRTSANVTNMLAGQMPGVTIIQNTGQPGADAGVLRVRGLGTMGDASAMVVVDGVPRPW